MFRIVCDPSSGSVECAWLKLLVIFFLCVVGVWQRNFEPAVCVHGATHHAHTPQVQNYAAKHQLRTRKISRVISAKHIQHSLMMDRKRSETCRNDF